MQVSGAAPCPVPPAPMALPAATPCAVQGTMASTDRVDRGGRHDETIPPADPRRLISVAFPSGSPSVRPTVILDSTTAVSRFEQALSDLSADTARLSGLLADTVDALPRDAAGLTTADALLERLRQRDAQGEHGIHTQWQKHLAWLQGLRPKLDGPVGLAFVAEGCRQIDRLTGVNAVGEQRALSDVWEQLHRRSPGEALSPQVIRVVDDEFQGMARTSMGLAMVPADYDMIALLGGMRQRFDRGGEDPRWLEPIRAAIHELGRVPMGGGPLPLLPMLKHLLEATPDAALHQGLVEVASEQMRTGPRQLDREKMQAFGFFLGAVAPVAARAGNGGGQALQDGVKALSDDWRPPFQRIPRAALAMRGTLEPTLHRDLALATLGDPADPGVRAFPRAPGGQVLGLVLRGISEPSATVAADRVIDDLAAEEGRQDRLRDAGGVAGLLLRILDGEARPDVRYRIASLGLDGLEQATADMGTRMLIGSARMADEPSLPQAERTARLRAALEQVALLPGVSLREGSLHERPPLDPGHAPKVQDGDDYVIVGGIRLPKVRRG